MKPAGANIWKRTRCTLGKAAAWRVCGLAHGHLDSSPGKVTRVLNLPVGMNVDFDS